jgi:uracil-DNA glycosylase
MSLSFIDERWSWDNLDLWKYVEEGNLPKSWEKFFDDETKSGLKYISENISLSKIIYPSPNLVFRAFCLPLEKVRVVVVGQDCYHDGNAVGICFSIPVGAKINPSLLNIYNELENEGYKPVRNGSLQHWADQGCLMLNTALTVEKSNPESHLSFWYDFSEKLFNYISDNTKNVAWILMGKHASGFKHCAEKNGHKAFITSHPSPFSAHRTFQNYPSFLNSGIFREVNKYLKTHYDKEIKW